MSIGLKCFVLVSMLLLAGDIESNPGPSIEEQFASLTEFVGSGFEEINKNIKDLRQEVSTLKYQFDTMQAEFKHKCDIMHADIDANAEAIETIRDRVCALEATVKVKNDIQGEKTFCYIMSRKKMGRTFGKSEHKWLTL